MTTRWTDKFKKNTYDMNRERSAPTPPMKPLNAWTLEDVADASEEDYERAMSIPTARGADWYITTTNNANNALTKSKDFWKYYDEVQRYEGYDELARRLRSVTVDKAPCMWCGQLFQTESLDDHEEACGQ